MNVVNRSFSSSLFFWSLKNADQNVWKNHRQFLNFFFQFQTQFSICNNMIFFTTFLEKNIFATDRIAFRHVFEKKQWKSLRQKMKIRNRFLCFKYFKFFFDQIHNVVRKIIENYDDTNVYFLKNVNKIQNNVSKWKWNSIKIMIVNFVSSNDDWQLTSF